MKNKKEKKNDLTSTKMESSATQKSDDALSNVTGGWLGNMWVWKDKSGFWFVETNGWNGGEKMTFQCKSKESAKARADKLVKDGYAPPPDSCYK